ncbi:Kinesin-like protein kif16b, partial [Branchiostoma belcheri]
MFTVWMYKDALVRRITHKCHPRVNHCSRGSEPQMCGDGQALLPATTWRRTVPGTRDKRLLLATIHQWDGFAAEGENGFVVGGSLPSCGITRIEKNNAATLQVCEGGYISVVTETGASVASTRLREATGKTELKTRVVQECRDRPYDRRGQGRVFAHCRMSSCRTILHFDMVLYRTNLPSSHHGFLKSVNSLKKKALVARVEDVTGGRTTSAVSPALPAGPPRYIPTRLSEKTKKRYASVTTRRTCFCVLSTCKNVGKRRASVRDVACRPHSYILRNRVSDVRVTCVDATPSPRSVLAPGLPGKSMVVSDTTEPVETLEDGTQATEAPRLKNTCVDAMASVKVAVRVRPLNQREIDLKSGSIIEMEAKRTTITNVKMVEGAEGDHGRERQKHFYYDYSYWSAKSSDPHFASQEQ